jgi:hypothetical protein
MTDPKTAKQNQKQESSGIGTRKIQIRKFTSFGCSEAPSFGLQTPDSPRANANNNTLGKATTLHKSLKQDSMLEMMQQRSKSGQDELRPTNLPFGKKSATPSKDNSMRSSTRTIPNSEPPSQMPMISRRKYGTTTLDQSRSFNVQNRNSVGQNPLSIIKDNIILNSVTRSQNNRVLFNQVSKIGDSMVRSQGTMKSILEKRTMGSLSPKKKN